MKIWGGRQTQVKLILKLLFSSSFVLFIIFKFVKGDCVKQRGEKERESKFKQIKFLVNHSSDYLQLAR
jgi:hypothetical protein